MKIIKTASETRAHIESLRAKGKSVGFVPTMGALHNGHLSLVRMAKKENDICIASIFVNPTQFDDASDLAKYPRTIDKDAQMLEREQCDVLFSPTVDEIYPSGTDVNADYDFGHLETTLEGAYRKNHFSGVGQVVARLLEIAYPNRLYLGQKDYQQCAILTYLVDELLKIDVEVKMCPIIREADGLAMSSRNARLTPQQRKDAVSLSESLQLAKTFYPIKTPQEIITQAKELLNSKQSTQTIDYFAIVDQRTLHPIETWEESAHPIALVAVRYEGVRLIDNMMIV